MRANHPQKISKTSFFGAWLCVLACALAAAGWITVGQAWTRRHLLNPAPIAERDRTQSQFVALLFPRITPGAHKYAMSDSELGALLDDLSDGGYVSIGVEDVRAFYEGRRLLPPKAVLLGFSHEEPSSVRLADRVMKRRRMRGVVFITQTARAGSEDRHRFITEHAVDQMRRGGAWDFGWRGGPAGAAAGAGSIIATLDEAPAPVTEASGPPAAAASERPASGLRFIASEMGLNGADTSPRRLNILALRSDRLRAVNLQIIETCWPRAAQLADDFDKGGLDPDWIPGWGIVSSGYGRLALLPLPRQTGAGVFLRGSDQWRDIVIEFDLKRRRREFWTYARYQEDDSWVRFGTRDGYWSVEQKVGPHNLPTLVARAPIAEEGRSARVRFVLKDQALLVHVNGRMLFGRPLRLHPRVARGRVLLAAYDLQPGKALGVVTRFRAGPVKDAWIAFKDGVARAGFDESRLDTLREAAVYARAVSPRWLSISRDGGVSVSREQETLIRSLAGFYGCRLVPMAGLPAAAGALLGNPAAAARLRGGLGAAARELDVLGINIRARGADLERPETARFLKDLRAELKVAGRRVWVTADGPADQAALAALPVDGVLRASSEPGAGYEQLDAVPPAAANAAKELAIK